MRPSPFAREHPYHKSAEQWRAGGACAQIAKLLIIPFVCLVEHFWLGKVFTRSVIGSVLTVVLGVGIVCVPSSARSSLLSLTCLHQMFLATKQV
jgi:uncharacterized membrane protein YbaN (DUF454 family)